MCRKAEESVNHVSSECSKLAQKEYKRRHDWFGTKIHWEICKKYGKRKVVRAQAGRNNGKR